MGVKFGGIEGDVVRKKYVPGPGTYKQEDPNKTIPSMKFGSGQRSDLADNPTAKIVPGPGNYSGDYKKVVREAPGYKIGTEARKSLEGNKKTPGPGNYNPNKSTDLGRSTIYASMKGRHESLDSGAKLYVPGPGAYESHNTLDVAMKTMPKFSIGREKRKGEHENKDKVAQPSPDAYKVKDDFTKTQAASWGFGSSKRRDLANTTLDVPGAGSYKINSKAIEGPTYAMGMRTLNDFELNRKINRGRPGPGAYEAVNCEKNKSSDPKFSFGNEKRPALGRNKNQL